MTARTTGARDQVARLLALVPYLQRGEGVPLRRVADEFGVSADQLRRDLKVLWMCGLPGLGGGDLIDINFEAFEDDPDGLVRIENAHYLTRPLRLGSTEASALIVALGALRDGAPPATREIVDRLLAKLEDATTGAPAPLVAHPAPATRASGPDPVALRRLLGTAVVEDRQVRLEYYVPSRDEATTRTVDPLALVDRDGHDYLDAWCHLVDGRRWFRLDRIDGAEALDTPRARPDEPPRRLGDALFEPGPETLAVTVRLQPRARWLVDHHPVESVRPGPEGTTDATLAVGEPLWVVRLVLGLAPDAEVLEPPEIAEEVRRQAAAALTLYDDAYHG